MPDPTPDATPDPKTPAPAAPPASPALTVGADPTTSSTPAWLTGLKELTTTTIALVILLVSMWMMIRTFLAAGTNFEQMKDVLLYALPILGSIIGYYFGRVPAERRAEAAEDSKKQSEQTAAQASVTANTAILRANDQTQKKENAEAKVSAAKTSVEKVRAALQADSQAGRRALSGGQESAQPAAASGPRVQDALNELEALHRQL